MLSDEERVRLDSLILKPGSLDNLWLCRRLRELDEKCRKLKQQASEVVNITELYWKLDAERDGIKADNAKLREGLSNARTNNNNARAVADDTAAHTKELLSFIAACGESAEVAENGGDICEVADTLLGRHWWGIGSKEAFELVARSQHTLKPATGEGDQRNDHHSEHWVKGEEA